MTAFQQFLLVLCTVLLSGCLQTTSTQPPNPNPQNAQVEIDKLCATSDAQLEKFPEPDHEILWDRIRANYKLQGQQHARIDKHLNWYKKHPQYMKRVSKRGEKYLFHIVEQLEQRNMPAELALLPIVESAFDPFAYSHGSASGMWQFISSTGKHYGLKQNWWYDGRRDVVAATDAALTYLSDLNRRFNGDWLLSLAAYNTGEGNVRRAVRRNKKLGLPTDFWSLKLPRETKAYVPQLLALSMVVLTPEQFDVTLTPIANEPYFASVNTESQIDLAQASSLSGVSIKDLYKLNPGFNRWATAPNGPHKLLVPIASAAAFRKNLQELPSIDRITWQRYTIKNGDSLISIAKKFKTEVATLRETNRIRGNAIRAGKTLMIPTASKSERAYALSSSQRIAKRQNAYKGKTGTQKSSYRVKRGDSLWEIAKEYNIGVRALAKWNSMAPRDTLKEGQKLVIWSTKSQIASLPGRTQDSTIIRKVSYKVRNGDSLARIAGKFKLSVNDIKRWNPSNKGRYIHPGQSLTLFVDVTRIN